MTDWRSDGRWIDWQAAILSAWLPVLAACAFFYLAIFVAADEPPKMLVVATLAIIPLEMARTLVLSLLSASFALGKRRLQAIYIFFAFLLFFFVGGFVDHAQKHGFADTFKAMIDPDFLKILGVPMLLMVVDGVINILAFRGDPHRQSELLDAINKESITWFGFMITRVPLAVLPTYIVLMSLKMPGFAIAGWVPDPSLYLLRVAGWTYVGCYFLGKAALIAQVHTARYARTGRGLFDATWARRIVGGRQPVKRRRDVEGAENDMSRPHEKQAPEPEQNVIRSAQDSDL